jgi:hypothetical protein
MEEKMLSAFEPFPSWLYFGDLPITLGTQFVRSRNGRKW